MISGKPLEGITVLELSTQVAIPACGRLLAYMGANVIKMEPPEGEPVRGIYYPYTPSPNNESPPFDILNAQKKSIAVNLKDPDVKPYILELVKKSDVFLTNVRAAGLERLGLSYEALRKINPKLVYAYFSGYGETGPLSKLPGYDSTAYFTRNGIYRDIVPADQPPAFHCPGLGDINCGTTMALAIVSALLQRTQTGIGQKVVTSLNSVGAWNVCLPVIYEQLGYELCEADGTPPSVGEGCFCCKDGKWVFYALGTEKQWEKFVTALDLTYLFDDPRCQTGRTRRQYTRELLPIFAERFMQYTGEEMLELLRSFDVPSEIHRSIKDIANDEQMWANDFVFKQSYINDDIVMVNPPLSFSGSDLTSHEKARPLGLNTKELFVDAGCSLEKFAELQHRGVVRVPEDT